VKILVTGARGQLGRAVTARCAQAWPTVGVDLPDGDLAEPAVAERLLAEHRPDRVIHCAAYTQVDSAESEPDLAMRVNADATANVARACATWHAGLTYVSTDYVFAGTATDGYAESDPRAPVNRYGETKAAGEEAVENLAPSWQIVRTSWLFGDGPTNFVLTIRRLLAERESFSVIDDQHGSPTYTVDLAELLAWLAGNDATGHFHGTNRGVCTWFAFAREIARGSGADPERIRPCTTADYPTPARRPAVSILRDTRLAELGAPPRPAWADAVRRYVEFLERT